MLARQAAEKKDFNSIKVRLKRPQGVRKSSFCKFQFHKGTIKTQKRERNNCAVVISIP